MVHVAIDWYFSLFSKDFEDFVQIEAITDSPFKLKAVVCCIFCQISALELIVMWRLQQFDPMWQFKLMLTFWLSEWQNVALTVVYGENVQIYKTISLKDTYFVAFIFSQ